GAVYNIKNGNLLYHGIVPFDDNGRLSKVKVINNKEYSGKDFFDAVDRVVRDACTDMRNNIEKSDNIDFMFYLWCGKYSPLFGKNRITTFENYFVEDKDTHKEQSNPYYTYAYEEKGADMIFENFGLDKNKAKIINGHVPVKVKDGEDPIKANGKVFVIDGGLSKGYQTKTGIAGYTLIYDSVHFTLASHKPFEKGKFNTPITKEIETVADRLYVKDTDTGQSIQRQIEDLRDLKEAYKNGLIREIY
ncbi:MAG: fructose-1,6-bisphosphatase, partial [Lachnospiraceae bacterium]|nr:fructose-1,6-bisphosphatase [Lachnospiraceae bacterium]